MHATLNILILNGLSLANATHARAIRVFASFSVEIQLLLRFPWMHRVVFGLLAQSIVGELRHQQRPDRQAFAQMRTRLPKCFLLVSDWFLVRFQ